MTRLFMIFTVAILLAGCTRKNTDSSTIPSLPGPHDPGSTIVFEIKAMPMKNFLVLVSQSSELTADDKKTIKKEINDDVYTRCSLAKYKRDGKLFMELNQFNLEKWFRRGENGSADTVGYSPAGTITNYEHIGHQWVGVGYIIHYD